MATVPTNDAFRAATPAPGAETVQRDPPAIQPLPSLTDIERRILEFMVSHLRAHTYQPSVREIGARFGIKSTKTVSEHLKSLAEKGFIDRDPARSRGIRLLGVDLNAQVISLPCFEDLDEASAGFRAGTEDVRISLDQSLVGAGGGFVVRAPGSRLAAAGINEGDFLVIRPLGGRELFEGEIVVARADGEADFFQLRLANGRGPRAFELHRMGGGAPAGEADSARHPVIVGRVAALFRSLDETALTLSVTTH